VSRLRYREIKPEAKKVPFFRAPVEKSDIFFFLLKNQMQDRAEIIGNQQCIYDLKRMVFTMGIVRMHRGYTGRYLSPQRF